jgi:hypothetical protein
MLGSNDRRALPATVPADSPPLDRINAKYTNRLSLANGIFRSAQSEKAADFATVPPHASSSCQGRTATADRKKTETRNNSLISIG